MIGQIKILYSNNFHTIAKSPAPRIAVEIEAEAKIGTESLIVLRTNGERR
ncbi:hypothetical protein [Leptospira brenneri]|nr:hypothetical protein [Leptospira brenneri]